MDLDVKHLIREGLREDGWPWDWTTLGSASGQSNAQSSSAKISAQLIAKAPGVWAGTALTRSLNAVGRELAETGDGHFLAKTQVKDGSFVRPGQRVAEWTGSMGLLLALERPFLNLAAYASGIATATHELVALARKACPENPPRVCSTRKTLPHYRDLALHAIRAGGGHAHRTGLAGGVLIKENHIASAGGIARAISGAREEAPHGLKIEVEVTDLGELEQALSACADAVLLDNFSVEDVKSAVRLIEKKSGKNRRPVVEVSGGLTASNLGRYAMPGVDVLSVGALTHSVKALDLSLLVQAK